MLKILKRSIFGVPIGFILIGVITFIALASMSLDFDNTITVTTPQQSNITATYRIDNGVELPLTNASTVYWGSVTGGTEHSKVMTIHLTNSGDLPDTVNIQVPSFIGGYFTTPGLVNVGAHSSTDTHINLFIADNAPTGDLPIDLGHITITSD
jgi:hypothetical protein